MSKQKLVSTNLESLMEMLASEDGVIRTRARKALILLGKPAVKSLLNVLQTSKLERVRWEAVKTLGEIGDPRAIPRLVEALAENDPDVAWLAADALRQFKKVAWPPLLRLLIKYGAESTLLRQRAHHVLRNQRADGFNDLLATLRKDLESNTVQESTPVAAYEILKQMKARS
jgi:HEAT repeats